MNNKKQGQELYLAIVKFINTLSDPSEMMQVAGLYEEWSKKLVGQVKIKEGEIVRHGVNADAEVQLYQALEEHLPQESWSPDVAVSLFKKIGFDDDGTPIWTQPLGGTDAYQLGDAVMYNGGQYVSVVADNIWAPDVYGWELTVQE